MMLSYHPCPLSHPVLSGIVFQVVPPSLVTTSPPPATPAYTLFGSVLEAAISILAFEFTGKEPVADHVKPPSVDFTIPSFLTAAY